MYFEIRASCSGPNGCGLGELLLLMRLSTDASGPLSWADLVVLDAELGWAIPTACPRCGKAPLYAEVAKNGLDPLVWLIRQEPAVASLYLAARRAGADHDDAVAAAAAISSEPHV